MRAADLGAFLETVAARPFKDGRHDCLLTVADWVQAMTGRDPAAPYRGRYRTALGRERLLRRLGGMEAVMSDGAARTGLLATDHPVTGDVGLIRHRGQALAAIHTEGLWAVQSSAGLTVLTADAVIQAWRAPSA